MIPLLLCCLAVGVLLAGLMRLSYGVGVNTEARRTRLVLEGLLAESREREAKCRQLLAQANELASRLSGADLSEVTAIQCTGCRKALASCACPMRARRGNA